MSTTPDFTIGQTVRWASPLRADWYGGRQADGMPEANDAGVGRIVARRDRDGYCGTCDHLGQKCPGPWFTVDFGDGPSSGCGGLYAGHELETA